MSASRQFAKLKPIPMGEGVPDVRLGEEVEPGKADMGDKPAAFIGGAGSRMKALVSFSKEEPAAVAQVGENKPVRLSTKGGRRKVAGQLGLPNVKKKKRK